MVHFLNCLLLWDEHEMKITFVYLLMISCLLCFHFFLPETKLYTGRFQNSLENHVLH